MNIIFEFGILRQKRSVRMQNGTNCTACHCPAFTPENCRKELESLALPCVKATLRRIISCLQFPKTTPPTHQIIPDSTNWKARICPWSGCSRESEGYLCVSKWALCLARHRNWTGSVSWYVGEIRHEDGTWDQDVISDDAACKQWSYSPQSFRVQCPPFSKKYFKALKKWG